METTAKGQSHYPKWSFADASKLVVIASLPFAAIALLWVFRIDLSSYLSLQITLLMTTISIASVVRILGQRYGRNTLWGQSLNIFVVAFYVAFCLFGWALFGKGIAMVALDLVAGTAGLFAGTGIGAIRMAAKKKRIVNGRLVSSWPSREEDLIYWLISLVTVAGAIYIVLGLLLFAMMQYEDYRPVTIFCGAVLGFGIYSLVWTYLYEKRTGIRVIIER